MIDRQRIAEGMKSLISDGLGRLNAVTGKHSVSSKLSLAALIALGLTLFFLAASGGNSIASKINTKKEQTNEDNGYQATENNGGNIASSIPITILNYVSSVDGKPTKDQQDENGNQNTSNRKPIDWVEIESFRAARENLESQKTITSSTETIARLTNDSNRIAITSAIVSIVALLLIWKTLSAANRANTIARESLEISNRAYLNDGDDFRVVENDGLVRIYIPLKNYGATPAIEVESFYICGLIDNVLHDERNVTFTTNGGDRFISMGSISGGGASPAIVVVFDVDKGEREFFVHLIFKYKSVFGGSYIESRYWETIKIKSDDHTSLRNSTPPKQIERKMQDLINRTKHTSAHLGVSG